MKVRDLIEMLEEMNPNAEVRLAQQPNYPLEYRVEDEIYQSADTETVYIGESEQVGYLQSEIREQFNW